MNILVRALLPDNLRGRYYPKFFLHAQIYNNFLVTENGLTSKTGLTIKIFFSGFGILLTRHFIKCAQHNYKGIIYFRQ